MSKVDDIECPSQGEILVGKRTQCCTGIVLCAAAAWALKLERRHLRYLCRTHRVSQTLGSKKYTPTSPLLSLDETTAGMCPGANSSLGLMARSMYKGRAQQAPKF